MNTESSTPALVELRRDTRRASKADPELLTAALLLVLTIVMLAGSRFISPSLGSWAQVQTVLTLGTFLLLVSFGQGVVVLTGGLDLSVAAMFMFGGVMTTALVDTGDAGVWYLIPGIVIAAGVVGCISGAGVAILKIPPFIMTMGMGITVGSLALGYSSGSTLGASPQLLEDLMKGAAGGVPYVVMLFISICIVGLFIQTRTVFGRNLYAVGGSPGAARVSGVPVTRTLLLAYGVSAMCAAAGGILLTGYSGGATLGMGEPYLLPSIAAVVVGGSSILGGRGTFIGTMVGTLFLTTLDSLISATGLEQGWRLIVSGLVIVIALLLQTSSGGPLAGWRKKALNLFR